MAKRFELALKCPIFRPRPAISVKPIAGGIELGIRYITRANERYAIRAKLYQGAIEVLGGKAGPVPKLPPLS